MTKFMKFYLLPFLIFFSFSVQAQNSTAIPPGTIQLNDSLYIDKAPIDNAMYREFENQVLKLWNFTLHDSLKALDLRDIDSSLMERSLDPVQSVKIYNNILRDERGEVNADVNMSYYLDHPRYQYSPAIRITKEQAELFCKWRTDMVNLLRSTTITKDAPDLNKVKYRIPSANEYKMAKNTFLSNEKLLLIDEESPLKIDLQDLRKKDNFILYKIPEFTSTGKKYLDKSFQKDSLEPSENSYTVFRCICEVQK